MAARRADEGGISLSWRPAGQMQGHQSFMATSRADAGVSVFHVSLPGRCRGISLSWQLAGQMQEVSVFPVSLPGRLFHFDDLRILTVVPQFEFLIARVPEAVEDPFDVQCADGVRWQHAFVNLHRTKKY